MSTRAVQVAKKIGAGRGRRNQAGRDEIGLVKSSEPTLQCSLPVFACGSWWLAVSVGKAWESILFGLRLSMLAKEHGFECEARKQNDQIWFFSVACSSPGWTRLHALHTKKIACPRSCRSTPGTGLRSPVAPIQTIAGPQLSKRVVDRFAGCVSLTEYAISQSSEIAALSPSSRNHESPRPSPCNIGGDAQRRGGASLGAAGPRSTAAAAATPCGVVVRRGGFSV